MKHSPRSRAALSRARRKFLMVWLLKRGLPRLGFCTCLVVAAPVATMLQEIVRVAPPHPDALVFPAIPTPRPAPTPTATPTPPATPLPTATPAPPRFYAWTMKQSFPLDVDGMTANDFNVSSSDAALRWEIVGVERQETTQNYPTNKRSPKLSLGVLMDASGSLADSDPLPGGWGAEEARLRAAKKLVLSLPSEVQIAVSHFPSTETNEAARIDQGFSSDKTKIVAALDGLSGKVSGTTPMWSGLATTLNALAQQPSYHKKHIICFTDGAPDSEEALEQQVMATALRLRVRVDFIALGSGDWSVIQTIAQATGGQVVPVAQTSTLDAAFERLAGHIQVKKRISYRVSVRVSRRGRPFVRGELLKATVRASSARANGQTQKVEHRVNATQLP